MDKIIYMDNAATTRLSDTAVSAVCEFLTADYANPGAVYGYADNAKRTVAKAREDIAATLGAKAEEIYFTAGGTESDNWALKGIAEAAFDKRYAKDGRSSFKDVKPHIITTSIEHHAVLNTCKWLEKNGCRVSYVKPDLSGTVSVSDIERLICDDTVLISVMLVNNELGTLQAVDEIGGLAHKRGIPLHTDAVAAYGHIPIDAGKMNIDMLSAGAHKFGGPKGTGFLYVNEHYKLLPLIHGGGQERGRRGGTENVAGIAGMAAAANDHHINMEAYLKRRRELDRYFAGKLEEAGYCFGGRCGQRRARLNGASSCVVSDTGGSSSARSDNYMMEKDSGFRRLPGCFNITIPGIKAEELIVRLGMEGICVSAGAVCASSSDAASHVLTSIGLDREAADSTIRISMDENNTEEEIDILFETIKRICNL